MHVKKTNANLSRRQNVIKVPVTQNVLYDLYKTVTQPVIMMAAMGIVLTRLIEHNLVSFFSNVLKALEGILICLHMTLRNWIKSKHLLCLYGIRFLSITKHIPPKLSPLYRFLPLTTYIIIS